MTNETLLHNAVSIEKSIQQSYIVIIHILLQYLYCYYIYSSIVNALDTNVTLVGVKITFTSAPSVFIRRYI